jgi:hypothetical protein
LGKLQGDEEMAGQKPIDKTTLDRIAPGLGIAIQKAIEEAGLEAFQLDSVTLKEKPPTAGRASFPPGCEVKCSVGGFPPKIECSLVCG